MSFVVTVTQTIPARRVADLLCCAFEGGINYWCSRSVKLSDAAQWQEGEYASDLPIVLERHPGAYIEAHDSSDTEQWVRLDMVNLQKGLVLMQEKCPKAWADFRCENEDAETGDIFVQLCLFGEVKYG